MRRTHSLIWAAAFGTATLAAAFGSPTDRSWAAGGCQTEIPVVGDVDGDGLADLAVGLPARAGAAGAVDLRLTSARSRVLTLQAAGLSSSLDGDRFGSAIALADLDADGCADFIVGAPGVIDDAGRVHLVHGAPDGFATTGGLTEHGGSTPGDRFGSAVAITENRGRGGFDVWVGSPYDDPGAVRDAGSVTHLFASAVDGELALTTVENISQATRGVPGTTEVGDHFGAVLTATPGGVLVGPRTRTSATRPTPALSPSSPTSTRTPAWTGPSPGRRTRSVCRARPRLVTASARRSAPWAVTRSSACRART